MTPEQKLRQAFLRQADILAACVAEHMRLREFVRAGLENEPGQRIKTPVGTLHICPQTDALLLDNDAI